MERALRFVSFVSIIRSGAGTTYGVLGWRDGVHIRLIYHDTSMPFIEPNCSSTPCTGGVLPYLANWRNGIDYFPECNYAMQDMQSNTGHMSSELLDRGIIVA